MCLYGLKGFCIDGIFVLNKPYSTLAPATPRGDDRDLLKKRVWVPEQAVTSCQEASILRASSVHCFFSNCDGIST